LFSLTKRPDSMSVYLLLQEGNEAGGWRQWQWWFLPSNQLTAILLFRRRQTLLSRNEEMGRASEFVNTSGSLFICVFSRFIRVFAAVFGIDQN
jgi:hypothetical protein